MTNSDTVPGEGHTKGLSELLAKVQAASGPDRGLDGLIARDVEGWLPAFDLEGDDLLDWPGMGGHWHYPGDPCNGGHSYSRVYNPEPPPYTSSIDAALAMVNRLFPAACVYPDITPGNHACGLRYGRSHKDTSFSTGATPALAIVGATLQALIAGSKP